jgi:heme-degrading monooxygenase HmoA
MYVRIVWGRLKSGKWDEYERHYNERVVPSTKGRQGLRERQLLRSTEDPEEGISLSVWEKLEDLHSYETSEVRKELAQNAEDLFQPWSYSTGEYQVDHFEIISTDRY